MESSSHPADRMSRYEPGLGLLGRLPRELRDQIYDLCHQKKHYTNALCYEFTMYGRRSNSGKVRFKICAPLPQLRLLNKTLTHEYDSRAPANTTMCIGAIVRHSYAIKLDQNIASEDALYLSLFTKEEEEASRHENLNVMRFEIAGVLTRSLQTGYFEHTAEKPSFRSVRLCLRFYDDPPSDLEGFNRVFGNLNISYTEDESEYGEALNLIEVVLLSDGWPLSTDEVPVIGNWTLQGVFKFNGVASGVYEWPENAVPSDQSGARGSESNGGSDGEASGAAEKIEDSNDSEDASQGSDMDWQYDGKSEDLKISDESGKDHGVRDELEILFNA
jgi:hypothetical protein